MGSNFFSSLFNPFHLSAPLIGGQSTVGKAIENDPLNGKLGPRLGGTYGGTQGGQPSAWSGVAPSLAAANSGYAQPGTAAYAKAFGAQSNPSTPGSGQAPKLRAWGGW